MDYGSTVTLPCNGSAYLEEGPQPEEGEEGEFRWEAVGSDVAFFQSGELVQGPGYEVTFCSLGFWFRCRGFRALV